MTSVNESITLFDAQASDATSAAQELAPVKLGTATDWIIVASGGFGGGTLKILLSYDGESGTFVEATNAEQTAPAVKNKISVNQSVWIKAQLTGATSATLTVKLYRRFYGR